MLNAILLWMQMILGPRLSISIVERMLGMKQKTYMGSCF